MADPFDLDRYIRLCEESGDFGRKERDELRALIHNPAWMKFVGLMLQEMNGKLVQFRKVNLLTPDGVAAATRAQGELDGLNRWLNAISEELNQDA